MSEDVDFKIVPFDVDSMSRSQRRKLLAWVTRQDHSKSANSWLPDRPADHIAAEELNITDLDLRPWKLPGSSRASDPTLVSHIYDLHVTRGHCDIPTVIALEEKIMLQDADKFRNQFPALR